ncbi:MAG: V-type ATP synthase subunit F [Candidatus Micrarchaeia archaeon]
MESRVNNSYKIGFVGGEELKLGLKLVGIRNAFSVQDGQEAESKIGELMQNKEIGIIIISSKILHEIKDRRILNAIDTSILPLFVEVPDYGSNYTPDTLGRLILRAIGIDITKMGN